MPNNEPLYVDSDARHLPFSDATFDAALSYNVLQHVTQDNLKPILSAIGRKLRHVGEAKIKMINKYGIKAQLDRLLGRKPVNEELNVRYFSIAEQLYVFRDGISPPTCSVGSFLGPNKHNRKSSLPPSLKRAVVDISIGLKSLSYVIPPLACVADSIFIRSNKNSL